MTHQVVLTRAITVIKPPTVIAIVAANAITVTPAVHASAITMTHQVVLARVITVIKPQTVITIIAIIVANAITVAMVMALATILSLALVLALTLDLTALDAQRVLVAMNVVAIISQARTERTCIIT